MRIQHNIMAMSAYRNYTNNVSAMKKNLEKLSSGYKINRAGDDAAGLAISEKMRAQITGLETAQKNAKDGISLVQTAEGALTEVHDMLNRMVALATQSANGTYDNETDRAQMQKEVEQLKEEINRIADSSNFNGIKLLDGSMSSSGPLGDFQNATVTAIADGEPAASGKTEKGEYTIDLGRVTVNAATSGDVSATLSIKVAGVQLLKITTQNYDKTGGSLSLSKLTQGDFTTEVTIADITFSVGFEAGVVTLKGKTDITSALAKSMATTSMTVSFTVTDGTSNQGDDLSVHHVKEVNYAGPALLAQASVSLTAQMVKNGNQITIGDQTYTFQVGKGNKASGPNVIDLTDYEESDGNKLLDAAAKALSRQSNSKFDITAVGGETGVIKLTEKPGQVDYDEDWDLMGAANTDVTSKKDAPWTNKKSGEAAVRWAAAGAATGKSLTLQIGDTAEDFNQLKVDVQDMHCSSLGIDDLNIGNQDGAAAAISKLKSAINMVSDVRGSLGATQNRLDHTINNLGVMTENIQDAESTIRDTDVAAEMMEYTKNNILIQSAQAMLAQANQVPQGVLQLLQ